MIRVDYKKTIFLLGLVALFLLFTSKSHRHVPKKHEYAHHYTVKSDVLNKPLFFNGTIQPLRQTALTSPLNAIIESMPTHYGKTVKKDEVVMVLRSNELQKQYNTALTDYLKSKDNYLMAKAKFGGTQSLWQEGLISKNNYLSEKSNVATTRMTFMQETHKLSEIIEKMDPKDNNKQRLRDLNIAEFDKVRQALAVQHQLITLTAPEEGVLLYPPKLDDKLSKLSVGSSVKANQVVGLVGNLNGISLEIEIPEVEIQQIYVGMSAEVRGIALGQAVFTGQVVAVNSQANSEGGMGLPSFTALVEVNHLTPEQKALIKVGMSASIMIPLEKKAQLLIPIAAISQEEGQSIVRRRGLQGDLQKQVITTGSALADKVTVLSGLKEGDAIVY